MLYGNSTIYAVAIRMGDNVGYVRVGEKTCVMEGEESAIMLRDAVKDKCDWAAVVEFPMRDPSQETPDA